ncbi:MAG: TonB-dependent receptor [Acidobacteriota bacterium]
MQVKKSISALSLLVVLVGSLPIQSFSQTNGTLRGTITYETNGKPLHNVTLRIVQLRRSVETNEQGVYEFPDVPPGSYTIIVHFEGFPDVARTISVSGGAPTTADFQLQLTGLREQVTVTASGSEQSTLEAFQSVAALDTTKLTQESHPSLGEVLEKEPGVAKRGFGPGPARPVIRGFDGDRVIVLQDGIRVGGIGSQSADNADPIDVLSLERVEVVRGPATLLYGSNAIGGVVNAVTGHDDDVHPAVGYLTGIGGTTNNQAAVSGGVEFGFRRWMFRANGTGQRTGDYNTPIGRIPNSSVREGVGSGGVGYYAEKAFFKASYTYDNRLYGIPFAGRFEAGGEAEEEEAQITAADRYHNLRASGGFRNLDSFVNGFGLTLTYNNYRRQELENGEVGSVFTNNAFSYRGLFDQRKKGRLTGRFGFEGLGRDFAITGAESLVPGTINQKAFSVFGLEELNLERVKFQFGGRVENNRYRPTDASLLRRSFTGFSGAAGVRVELWKGGAFVANYSRSYRAPALEELYFFGPHVGTLTFEIGNPTLPRELGNGIDLSLRHTSKRVHLEGNVYYYRITDFVFLAPQDANGDGEIDFEDGLPVKRYDQDDSRYLGTEVSADFTVHPNVDINLGLDYVRAELKDGTPLPRIPPLRGRVGFDAHYQGVSIRPEVVLAKDQNRLFPLETRTAGYAVFNVLASYTLAQQHAAHIFSVNAFNLGDRLYRNHLSFIKDLAPEIGRGVRLTYTVRFF